MTNRRNIRSLSALCNILVLSSKVLAYSSFATSYSYIFTAYWLKVLALALLCKGDAIIVSKVYNAAIKLKIVSKSKVFTLLSYKLSLLKLYLFLLSKTFVSYKKRIISLKANDAKWLIAIKETRIVG